MNPVFGPMHRDSRDEWPDEDPNTTGHQLTSGKFDIVETTVGGYPGATARLIFVCPFGKTCGLLLAPQPIPRSSEDRLFVWGWDGNSERPTLTPSINCIAEKDGKPTGGCGWHGFITDGVMK
jgi:hypothetical protein